MLQDFGAALAVPGGGEILRNNVWRPGEADYVTKSLTRGKLELGQELLVGSKLNLYQNDMI